MTIWHPHTEQPSEDLTTAIIAIPPTDRDDEDQGPMLMGCIYTWKHGRWVSEEGEQQLIAGVYWWCAESYLLDDLPDAAHERVPAVPDTGLVDAREACA